jgi:hypothetical protein
LTVVEARTALLVVYLFASVCLLVASGSVCSAGDVKAGRAKALMCQACHGLDGLSKVPDAPSIAGQTEPYVVAQLQAYKSGVRKNESDVGGSSIFVGHGHRGSCGLFFGHRDQRRKNPGPIGGGIYILPRPSRRSQSDAPSIVALLGQFSKALGRYHAQRTVGQVAEGSVSYDLSWDF